MKQEASVLQWASLMMEKEVKTLDSVQNVPFVKTLLWRIDPDYFYQWQAGGKGSENYAQVLSYIEKYFKEEIGTDIKQHLEGLNVYKQPMELWELLLGIAIKGNNRGENITLILDMDHVIQAELVGIVSGIIDKFGQNAAQNNEDEMDDLKQEFEPGSNEQMLRDLANENKQLSDQIDEMQAELEKSKQEVKTLSSQKKQIEHELTMLKHQKNAFIDIMATANRTESRIFDDGDENVLSSPSLSELANDLTIFVRNLKKKLAEEQYKNSVLEEHLKEATREAVRCADENQSYMLQLGNLNSYEHEIEQLREEINEICQENSDLIEQVNRLEEEKAKLIISLQLKTKEKEMLSEEPTLEAHQESQRRRTQREKIVKKEEDKSVSSSESNRQGERASFQGIEKNLIRKELREPKFRNKLQAQIQNLKKKNESLKSQNYSLKVSNQSLQQSASSFMISNKQIVHRWEDDYQQLLAKISQMTEAQNTGQPSIPTQSQEIPKEEGPQHESIAIQSSEAEEFNAQEPKLLAAFSFGVPLVRDNKQSLWEEIGKKLGEIVRKGKQRELSLQNTINSLRSQNLKWIRMNESNENHNKLPNAEYPGSSSEQISKLDIHHSEDIAFHINVLRTDGEKSQEDSKKDVLLSYLSIKEGEELDEHAIQKRREVGTSEFYNVGSHIVADFKELKEQPSESSFKGEYLNLNRALFKSIRSNIQSLKEDEVKEISFKTTELQRKLHQEISEIQDHYQELNHNYQQIFDKLQLYSSQFNQAELAKKEYHKILEQLRMIEEEVKANQNSEIVKLRLLNDQLHQGLAEAAVQKHEILKQIEEAIKSREVGRSSRQLNLENNYATMLKALEEIKMKYKLGMIEPLEFLSIRLDAGKEGEIQKFYKMYLKQKEKCRQLTEELELLSGVLLQYNTIVHY